MNKRTRQYIGLLSAVIAYYLIHEGAHFLYALSIGAFKQINFMGLGIAAGIGPIVLAIVYLILQQTAAVETLSVNQVCIGIFSITALAFIAGGMNAIYQIERLPLMLAILIHGGVLYVGYLGTYLLNDWLDFGILPMIVFTAIFVVGYAIDTALHNYISNHVTALSDFRIVRYVDDMYILISSDKPIGYLHEAYNDIRNEYSSIKALSKLVYDYIDSNKS